MNVGEGKELKNVPEKKEMVYGMLNCVHRTV